MSESFDWNQPGLDRGHFDSLANLLSLRNGGQAEPSSLSDAVLDEDWDFKHGEDEDGASLDTGFAYQISDSGHLRLKRRFLDCLAEFAANKQGGMAVACSTMKEAEDNVVIWISRNEGFSDGDKPKFDKLGGLLGSLSSNDGTSFSIAMCLRTELINLVQPTNLRHFYGSKWFRISRTGLTTATFLI